MKSAPTLDTRARENKTIQTTRHRARVGDHNWQLIDGRSASRLAGSGRARPDGPDEKLWTGRHVEPPFKLLFEAHAFMELTDRHTHTHTHTHTHARNNVPRSPTGP